ncbi:uncharacterized protein [Diadema setosum]|uniref:uncharacterized protein n=1 Tax=Diadema setosum TaxID=31175 RepID=UPI003B3BA0CB
MGDRDFDDILKAVATDVHDDLAIEEFGKALGFRLVKTKMRRYGEFTNRDTLQMLRKWQKNVGKAKERSLLRQKLIDAGLRRVADRHLPETAQATSQAARPSIITDLQIIELSNFFPLDKYDKLAVHLGLSIEDAHSIDEKYKDKKATKVLLMTWKRRKGGRIEELDTALKNMLHIPEPLGRIRQDSYVTESQIIKLSTLIPPSSYMDLAVVLGYGFAEFEAIMARNMSDTMKATVELLNTWKTRTRGPTNELDLALIAAMCGGVIEQYKQ